MASSVIVSITLFARKHLIRHNKPKIHVQPRSSALNVTLPAFAAERRAVQLLLMSAPAAGTRRRQLSIDFRAAELPAANPPATAAAADRWDRQTDGPFHRPCSAYAGSANMRTIHLEWVAR